MHLKYTISYVIDLLWSFLSRLSLFKSLLMHCLATASYQQFTPLISEMKESSAKAGFKRE